jgi:maltoporin
MVLILSATEGYSQDSSRFIYSGYMRSGFGLDGRGGPYDVFRAPNSDAKYRLGNEAEACIEALLGYSLKERNGAEFETNLRLAFVTPTSKSNEFLTTTSLREAYVKGTGIFKIQPQLGVWAGQRFYDHTVVFNRSMNSFSTRPPWTCASMRSILVSVNWDSLLTFPDLTATP